MGLRLGVLGSVKVRIGGEVWRLTCQVLKLGRKADI